jgi:hypothetical protein
MLIWACGWHCISTRGAGSPCSTHAPVFAKPLELTGETLHQAGTACECRAARQLTCCSAAWRQRFCGRRAGGLAALFNKVLEERTRHHAGRVNTALTGICIKAAPQGVAGYGGHALSTFKQSTASVANLPCSALLLHRHNPAVCNQQNYARIYKPACRLSGLTAGACCFLQARMQALLRRQSAYN